MTLHRGLGPPVPVPQPLGGSDEGIDKGGDMAQTTMETTTAQRTLAQVTDAQRTALTRLFARHAEGAATVEEFAERGGLEYLLCGGGCVMVQWCGMTIGIEPDGYTHS